MTLHTVPLGMLPCPESLNISSTSSANLSHATNVSVPSTRTGVTASGAQTTLQTIHHHLSVKRVADSLPSGRFGFRPMHDVSEPAFPQSWQEFLQSLKPRAPGHDTFEHFLQVLFFRFLGAGGIFLVFGKIPADLESQSFSSHAATKL